MIAGLLFLTISVAPAVLPDEVPPARTVYAGVAVSDDDVRAEPKDAPAPDSPPPAPATTPLVSINTDILDMSWTGAMDLADPMMRPAGIILPFLESYPIDNIEVKLRLLNLKF